MALKTKIKPASNVALLAPLGMCSGTNTILSQPMRKPANNTMAKEKNSGMIRFFNISQTNHILKQGEN
jgi:hypothetical protein